MTSKLNLIPVLATACLFTLSLQTAQAAGAPTDDDRTVSQVVRFGDLDLATTTGKKTLQGRLRAATRQVCRLAVPPIPGMYIENAKCRQAVLQDALTQVFGEGGIAARVAARRQVQTVLTTARRVP